MKGNVLSMKAPVVLLDLQDISPYEIDDSDHLLIRKCLRIIETRLSPEPQTLPALRTACFSRTCSGPETLVGRSRPRHVLGQVGSQG